MIPDIGENSGMFRRFAIALLLMGLATHAAAQPSARAPLEIGIFPYLSTRALLSTYQPLQHYLEQRMQRPVHLVTAPDMQTFVERTQAGAYMFVVTAPHFARLAQLEAGYRPLLRGHRSLSGALLVRKQGGIRGITDLRGKSLATPDNLTIISVLGLELLKRNGLTPGKDVTIQYLPTHNSAVVSLQNGAVDAAVVSMTAFVQMTRDQHAGLSIIAQTSEVPPVMYLASPRVSAAEAETFAQALRQFIEDTPAGKKFIDGLGYQGLRPPSDLDLRSLDPYLSPLKANLAKPR